MKNCSFGLLPLTLASFLFVSMLPVPSLAQAAPAGAVDDAKYPKPDMKEVEKFYKVVTYRYDDAKERLIMKLVPLVESVPTTFKVVFYDEGGERIDSGYTLHYYSTVVGEPKTCDIGVPKRVMDKAKKATITRP